MRDNKTKIVFDLPRLGLWLRAVFGQELLYQINLAIQCVFKNLVGTEMKDRGLFEPVCRLAEPRLFLALVRGWVTKPQEVTIYNPYTDTVFREWVIRKNSVAGNTTMLGLAGICGGWLLGNMESKTQPRVLKKDWKIQVPPRKGCSAAMLRLVRGAPRWQDFVDVEGAAEVFENRGFHHAGNEWFVEMLAQQLRQYSMFDETSLRRNVRL
jgi:hypothetical protein